MDGGRQVGLSMPRTHTPKQSHRGDPEGRKLELGHGVTAFAITAIASAQIAAIMRDRTLNAAEKQQGTRTLLASQKPPLSPMSSESDSGFAEPVLADAAFLLKPLLTVDSCGLAMWSRSKTLNKTSNVRKLAPAPSPWTSDSDSENGSDASDCASKYPKGASSFFFDRSASSKSASEASTRSASSDTWATSMTLQKPLAVSQGMVSASNHNTKAFGPVNTALLQKVLKLEAETEALHMKIEILRADSKAQEAKIAHVQATAKSEIEYLKANAAAESEQDSRVLTKIVKKLKIDSDAEKAKNKVGADCQEAPNRHQSPEGKAQSRACSNQGPSQCRN